jgi:hypothetical protein
VGYIWEYGQVESYEPQPMRLPVRLASSYDVDLWGDNKPHAPRPHVRMHETTDNREFKAIHLDRQARLTRWCTCQFCLVERGQVKQLGSRHATWKKHRAYQARNRRRGLVG